MLRVSLRSLRTDRPNCSRRRRCRRPRAPRRSTSGVWPPGAMLRTPQRSPPARPNGGLRSRVLRTPKRDRCCHRCPSVSGAPLLEVHGPEPRVARSAPVRSPLNLSPAVASSPWLSAGSTSPASPPSGRRREPPSSCPRSVGNGNTMVELRSFGDGHERAEVAQLHRFRAGGENGRCLQDLLRRLLLALRLDDLARRTRSASACRAITRIMLSSMSTCLSSTFETLMPQLRSARRGCAGGRRSAGHARRASRRARAGPGPSAGWSAPAGRSRD